MYLYLTIFFIFLVLFCIELVAYLTRKFSILEEDKKVAEIMNREKKYEIEKIEEGNMEKNILQTYKDINNVPKYVVDNLKDKNLGWKYHFYSDKDCEKFIKDNYGIEILAKYLSIKGKPHRADIFRLCWLYKNGGVYVDIDTQILIPLDKLVENKKFSIPITHDRLNRKRLLNCIIITNKGNPLIRECLENILKIDAGELSETKYYYLYLLTMQKTLEGKTPYHFREINREESNFYLLRREKWIILDEKDELIGFSKYESYSHGKGFV